MGKRLDLGSCPPSRELSSIDTISTFAATKDGQRFLALVRASSVDAGAATVGERINVILHWFEELKQRVPTGG